MNRNMVNLSAVLMVFFAGGCTTSEIRPVDIFPEDNCAQCRMAISDVRFASEIIDEHGEAAKFDDLGCMLKYKAGHPELNIMSIFLKDYDTKQWTRYEHAAIVETDVDTPMGSGKVAFADAEKAKKFRQEFPKAEGTGDADTCCE